MTLLFMNRMSRLTETRNKIRVQVKDNERENDLPLSERDGIIKTEKMG